MSLFVSQSDDSPPAPPLPSSSKIGDAFTETSSPVAVASSALVVGVTSTRGDDGSGAGTIRLAVRTPFLVFRHFEMPCRSDGRFANAWNTWRLRIIVYTKFELPIKMTIVFYKWSKFFWSLKLPSNWYWMMLLKISSRKKTKWWLDGAENRNHGVLNASSKCNSLIAATIDRVFKYGDTKFTDIHLVLPT